MPALPLDEAGQYVAGAYVAFLALVLIYVAIMAVKLQRIDRELGELAELAEGRVAGASDEVADRAAEPAVSVASHPIGSGREAEHSDG
jgi:hypothetical protein